MSLARATPDQSVEKSVQAALDKQAEILGTIRSDHDQSIEDLRGQLGEVRSALASLTSDDAPGRVIPRESHQAMIDEQVAGQVRAQMTETQRRIEELEILIQRSAEAEPGQQSDPVAVAADAVLANGAADLALAQLRNRNTGWVQTVEVPSLIQLPRVGMGAVRETLGAPELEALTPRFRRGEVVYHLREPTNLMGLLRRVPTGASQRYEFVRQTFAGLHGSVNTTATAALSTDTAITVVDGSVFADNFLVYFHTTAGPIARYVTVAGNVLTILDVPGGTPTALGVALAGGEQVTSEEFKAVPEESVKPDGFDQYEELEQFLVDHPEFIRTTEQRLHYAPAFRSQISRELVVRWMRAMDWHLLYGAGTGLQADTQQPGFFSEAGAQTIAWSAGVTGDSRADVLIRAAALIFTEDNAELAVCMSRDAWVDLMLTKASDGHYIQTNSGPVVVSDRPGARMVGPMMVHRSGKILDTDALVFAPAVASEIADAEDARLALGTVDDDFKRNKLAIRYSHSVLHAILTTTGYVLADWDAPPA